MGSQNLEIEKFEKGLIASPEFVEKFWKTILDCLVS